MEVNNGDGVGHSNMSRKVTDEENSAVVIPETAHQISSGLFPFVLTRLIFLSIFLDFVSVFVLFRYLPSVV